MLHKFDRLILGLVITLPTLGAWAGELYEGHYSVRALGMGNAYTAVVADGDSLFYNPAGLAHVEGFNLTLLDPYVGLSDPTQYKEVAESLNASNDLSAIVEPLFGKSVFVGAGTKSAFFMPYFGIAGYGDGNVSLNVENPALPNLNLRGVMDYGGVVGVAFPLVPGLVHMGVGIKRIIRTGGLIPITAGKIAEMDMALVQEELQRKGTAFGVDLGLTMSLPGPIRPAASFVWKNAGGLSFTKTGGPGKPPSEKGEMIAGFSGTIDIPLIDLTVAADFKHLDDADVQIGKKAHIGAELGFLMFDVRAGLHQGYMSYGGGMSLGLIEVDVASYGVELGEYPGQLEDRRYMVQVKIELGIDPFGFGGGGGADGKGGKSGGGKSYRRRGIKVRR